MHEVLTKLYRFLLRLYPADFRHEYKELMAQAFRDRLRDARREGTLATGMYCLNALFDLITNALGERLDAAHAQPLKYRAMRTAGFIALFLSYPLLWYGLLVMLVFYAEPTGFSSPTGTVQYYAARLVRIPALAYGLPTLFSAISLLIVIRGVRHSSRIAPLWLLALTNTLTAPITVLSYFPVRALVHGLGWADWQTYDNWLYYPPIAFCIWIPVLLAQIALLLWLHHRIARWSLFSRAGVLTG